MALVKRTLSRIHQGNEGDDDSYIIILSRRRLIREACPLSGTRARASKLAGASKLATLVIDRT
jgi:hypothetical protein